MIIQSCDHGLIAIGNNDLESGGPGIKSQNNGTGFQATDNETGVYANSNYTGARAINNYNGFFASNNYEGFISNNNELNGFLSQANDGDGIRSVQNNGRAAYLAGDLNSTHPAVEILHENDNLADLHLGGIGRITTEAEKGISLAPIDAPLITRGFAPFTSGNKEGVGRWGLFMETFNLVIGMPAIASGGPGTERNILFGKYNEDSTYDTLASVNQDGVICATNFSQCSDSRYKQTVSPLKNALCTVNQLNGVTYYWDRKRWPNRFSEDKQIGFIAQEVEKIFPELVHTDSQGYKSVSYAKVTPILVEAIKEQQKEIKKLKTLLENTLQRIVVLEKANEE